ncbi:MAG: sugar phosphate isomerase/epimerase [Anaerolineae bacterium]|nr:sugar phosphate isomerase/epimerase [Anaerolineae bacterium]
MDFSCHTWAFNDLTLSEALGTIARMGFRYVDIGSGQNLNAVKAAANPQRAAAEIAEDLLVYNLKVSDLYLMLPRISASEDDKRQKDLDLFKALLPFAAALSTPGITVSPGVAQPAEDEEAWDRAVVALREMVKAAHAAKLRLSIEPHLDSLATTPEQALKLLKDVPGLEITLDWAHMVCQDIFHDEIVKLLPHARHVQVRQAARQQLQTPFERGRIDLARVVADLQSAHYEGIVCIELMNIPGWHGMMKVDVSRESLKLRSALKAARDSQPTEAH